MPVVEPIIRPPSEAESFLLQVTTGCSACGCTFCGAYSKKPFKVKDLQEVFSDIEEESRRYPGTRRAFLMDGDALAVSNDKLVPVLQKLNSSFPALSRISSYANGCNITRRTDAELKELYRHKLTLIYMGLESGSQKVLDSCRKVSSAEEMIEAVRRADACSIKSSVIVLLGLGGRERSDEHVRGTIQALNRMQPRYLSFLSVMLIPGTPLHRDAKEGRFTPLDPIHLLQEMRDIISGLELSKTIFRSNHASNHLPLEGRFPNDKQKLVDVLDAAVRGKIRLKPEFLRGL
jgi:radical SAM superfamily enzyme YgiQ (UPF0313 family)